MNDTDSRLTRAEMQLEQHEKMHQATQDALQRMADGINRLSQIESQRVEDQKTIGRLFDSLKELRDKLTAEIGKIREDFEEYKNTQIQRELAEAQAALTDQNKRIWDAKSAILSAVGMLLLWIIAEKFGIHIQ